MPAEFTPKPGEGGDLGPWVSGETLCWRGDKAGCSGVGCTGVVVDWLDAADLELIARGAEAAFGENWEVFVVEVEDQTV